MMWQQALSHLGMLMLGVVIGVVLMILCAMSGRAGEGERHTLGADR